jgi:ribulose kinase
MDSFTETLEEVRRLLVLGENRRAAALLTAAADGCDDAVQASQIHALAATGRKQAGLLSRRAWDDVLQRSEHMTGASEPA